MKLTGGEAVTEQAYLDRLERQPDALLRECGWCRRTRWCTQLLGRLTGGGCMQASYGCDPCQNRYNLKPLNHHDGGPTFRMGG